MRRLIMLAVLAGAVLVGGCIPVKGPAPTPTGDGDCPFGLVQVNGQPWAEAQAVCVDGGEGWSGHYDPGANVAQVNAHYGYPDVEWYRSVGAHEEGHAWNVHHLTNPQRDRYAQVRGLADAGQAFEDYADVFALVVAGARYAAYGTASPSPDQVATLCAEGLLPC